MTSPTELQEPEPRTAELKELRHALAHDLRAPLRAIEGFASILERDLSAELNDQERYHLELLVAGSHQAMKMVEGLTRLVAIAVDAGTRATTEGATLAQEALSLCRAELQESHAEVTLVEPFPSMQVQQELAAEALAELVRNAVTYSGGSAPDIELRGLEVDGCSGFAVLDRGLGIDGAEATRVRALFQRGVHSEIQGTGIGLALADRVAARHGGSLRIATREGGGAEIQLLFGNSEEPHLEPQPCIPIMDR